MTAVHPTKVKPEPLTFEANDGPALCIMLLTYNRLEYAKTTLQSILEKIHYTRGHVYVHIASDGDEDEYVETLRKLEPSRVFANHRTSSNSHRGGYGANYNLGTQTVHVLPNIKYVLPLEDDWECIKELDADAFTLALDSGKFGCVRLGYLGYTQDLRGKVVAEGDIHYLLLDTHSPEPHVFAGHPRIETVDWERTVGPWIEGIGAGATEFEVTHRYEARNGVAWPLNVNPTAGYGIFAHIGTDRAEDVA